MSAVETKISNLASQVSLAQYDISEIKRLQDDLRFFANALHNKVSLHDGAD